MNSSKIINCYENTWMWYLIWEILPKTESILKFLKTYNFSVFKYSNIYYILSLAAEIEKLFVVKIKQKV